MADSRLSRVLKADSPLRLPGIGARFRADLLPFFHLGGPYLVLPGDPAQPLDRQPHSQV